MLCRCYAGAMPVGCSWLCSCDASVLRYIDLVRCNIGEVSKSKLERNMKLNDFFDAEVEMSNNCHLTTYPARQWPLEYTTSASFCSYERERTRPTALSHSGSRSGLRQGRWNNPRQLLYPSTAIMHHALWSSFFRPQSSIHAQRTTTVPSLQYLHKELGSKSIVRFVIFLTFRTSCTRLLHQ